MIDTHGNPVAAWARNTGKALVVRFAQLMKEEAGQDLVEYALLVALIAFGATAGMKALGTGINTTFTHISTTLAAQ